MCSWNVNNKTFLSSDSCSGMSLSEEERNRVNIIRQGSKRAHTIAGVAKGNIRKKRLFLCFPAWAREQMTDLTAGHLAELSFWSEPSCLAKLAAAVLGRVEVRRVGKALSGDKEPILGPWAILST